MNPVALGAAVVAALDMTDPVGIPLMMAMQVPIITWTIANVVAVPTMGTPLIAAGPVVTGTGGFTVAPSTPLTVLIASALGVTDGAAIAKMELMTAHYADTIRTYGVIDPSALVAYAGPAPPPTGPVAGFGKMLLTQPFQFYTAMGITDAPGIAKWTAYGNALKSHLEAFAIITPAMINPAPFGPLTGTGVVT